MMRLIFGNRQGRLFALAAFAAVLAAILPDVWQHMSSGAPPSLSPATARAAVDRYLDECNDYGVYGQCMDVALDSEGYRRTVERPYLGGVYVEKLLLDHGWLRRV